MGKLQSDLLERLEGYQARKGLSRKALAKKLGVSVDSISQWLERHRKLRPKECARLEGFLDREGVPLIRRNAEN